MLGLPRNDRLKDRIQPLIDDLRDRLKQDPHYAQRAVRGYQSFGYRTRDSWSRERRVIAKAEWLPGKPIGNADGGPEAVAEGPCAPTGETRYHSRFAVPPAKKRGKHTHARPPKPFRTRDATCHAPYPTHPVKNIIFDLVMRNPG